MEWSFDKFIPLSIIFFSIFLLKTIRSRKVTRIKPPGPRAWPIFGNIFDLGTLPHRSLYKLRFKYGDLLWLRLGLTNTLVIQTTKAAQELFKNHDIRFCGRKVAHTLTSHNFDRGSISWGQHDDYWRFLRRIVTLGLVTNKRINETARIRRKCVDSMLKYIEDDVAAARARGETGELVISHYVFVMAFNLMGNLTLSRDLLDSQSNEGLDFYHAMEKVTDLAGEPNLADFLPFLKRFDPQRKKKKMELALGRTLSILTKFVKERIEEKKLMKEKETKDFLDSMLEYEANGKEEDFEKISTHNILILILEIFFGGTETITSTVEWIVAELFRRPESMRKVKEELDQVVGPKRNVEESDINKLTHLQAAIKESFRLHPIFPFLLPRNTIENANFMGYFIPKDTQVLVNVWAMGRDPDVWEDPLSFKPERFLDSGIDYKGHNFELLPFGSGRRICLGLPLADRILHLVVASLLHSFDWELDNNFTPETIDMKERMGLAVRMLQPLKAIPKKRIIQV